MSSVDGAGGPGAGEVTEIQTGGVEEVSGADEARAAELLAGEEVATEPEFETAGAQQSKNFSASLLQGLVHAQLDESGTGQVSALDDTEAEARVREAGGRETDYALSELQSDPKAFLEALTQVDGDDNTKVDQQMCGVMSVLGGVAMADPQALVDLAEDLQSGDGIERFPELDKEPAKSALKRIADADDTFSTTKFSPEDVNIVGKAMAKSMKIGASGMDNNDMMDFMADLKATGADLPDMELHLFRSTDGSPGGHWQSAANGKEFDPWPNAEGKATIIEGGGGLAHGMRHVENGGVHTKIVTRKDGDRIEVHNHIRRSFGDRNQVRYESDQSSPLAIQFYDRSGGKFVRKEDATIKNRPGALNEKISYNGRR